MEDLIQNTAETDLFDEPPVAQNTPKAEDVTAAALNQGMKLDAPETKATIEQAKESQKIGDNSFVQQAKVAVDSAGKQQIIDKHLGQPSVDLVALDKELSSRQVKPEEWIAAAATKHALGSQEIVADSQEQFDRADALFKSSSAYVAKQQALNALQEEVIKLEDEQPTLDWWIDFASAIVEPGQLNALLANTAAEFTGDANLAGYALPTVSVNAIIDRINSFPIEGQADEIMRFMDLAARKNSQLGQSANRQANTFLVNTIVNSIKENRLNEGIGGIKNPSDLGLDILGTIDIFGVIKALKTLGSKAPKLIDKLVGGVFKKKAKTAAVRNKVVINPNLDLVENRGALGDALEKAKPGTIEQQMKAARDKVEAEAADKLQSGSRTGVDKDVQDALQAEVDKTLDELGLTPKGLQQRSQPNVTGALDDVSLPPSATNPLLKDLWELFDNSNDKILLGNATNREKIFDEFHNTIKESFEGHPHKSRSFTEEPVKGDTLSLGTSVTRFGKNPQDAYKSQAGATRLNDKLKAQGESASVIQGEDGKFWVEVRRRHVIDEKDAGVFSNITGQRLTAKLGSWKNFISGWSKLTKGVMDGMNPQAMTSWARDLDAAVGRELSKVADPFFKLQRGDKLQYKEAVKALRSGEANKTIYTRSELRELQPNMTDEAFVAYNSYLSAAQGMRVARAMVKRRALAKAGRKEIVIGDETIHGTVLKEPPVIAERVLSKDGSHVAEEGADRIISGTQVYDPLKGEAATVTDAFLEDLYKNGGVIIKTHGNYMAGDTGGYSHIVANSKKAFEVSELPVLPGFGREGYATQRFYEDASFVVKARTERTINGVKGFVNEGVGIAKTKDEANRLLKALEEEHPDTKFRVDQSRELNYQLGESAESGGANGPTWARRRKDELLRAVDRNNQLIDAPTKGFAESFGRGIADTSSIKLQETSGILKQRWMNQFGNLLKGEAKKNGFPKEFSNEMLDHAKIREMGVEPNDVLQDARLLHYNINSMEQETTLGIVKRKRAFMAGMARAAGASDSFAGRMAHKAITKANELNPFMAARHITAVANIGLSLYQLPQNILSAMSLIAIQGGRSVSSIIDATHLVRGLSTQGTAAELAAIKALSSRLSIDLKTAKKYIRNYKTSGIAGSASDVDNVVSYAVLGEKGVTGSAGAALKRGLNKVTGVVGKSIDVTNFGFYSAAFRKTQKEWTTLGKKIGTDDFFAEVNRNTRRMGQNQNRSDLIGIERQNNPAVFAMQFAQHLLRLGDDMVDVVRKAGGSKVDSAFVSTQGEAISALVRYFAIFGAAGIGHTGVEILNSSAADNVVPDWIVNPNTKSEKLISDFVNGGILDVLINLPTKDSELSVAAGVSPGGSVDLLMDKVDGVRLMMAKGAMDTDVADLLFGATATTFSNIGRNFAGLMSLQTKSLDDMTPEELSSAVGDFALEFGKAVGRTAKTFTDVEIAIMEANLKKSISKSSGKTGVDKTLFEAVGQAFGFKSRGEIIQGREKFENYVEKEHFAKISGVFTNLVRQTYMRDIEPGNQESYQKWAKRMERRATILMAGARPDQEKKLKSKIYAQWLSSLDTDKELTDRIQSLQQRGLTPQELFAKLARDPSLTQDKLDYVRFMLESIKQVKEQNGAEL